MTAAAPEEITVIAPSPVLGSGIDRDKLPAETTVLNSADIAGKGAPDLLGALNDQIGGVSLASSAGNDAQPTLFYHGFAASPLQGNSQGLAVYVGGVRFNQPFGDTVDWDLIPDIAISKLNVEGANPVFGLNALGGAINIRLKDGFNTEGGAATLSGGSFGRIEATSDYAAQSGNTAFYVAGTERHEDGWRDLQTEDLQNLYADLGWRRDESELHLNTTLANSVLNGPGTAPVELLAADPRAQFTAPNLVANKYARLSLTGTTRLTDDISLQGVGYASYFLQRIDNGNVANDGPCPDLPGFLCQDNGAPSTTRGGGPIADFLSGGPYSELDRQTTNTNSYGGSLQLARRGTLFGRDSRSVAGISYDGARTLFSATAILGGLNAARDFTGPGIVIDEPGTSQPVRVAISNDTAGLFASETLDVTSKVALTASARFNSARIGLTDQGGGTINGQHRYDRLNPAAGISYKAIPWLTIYAGYAEANRAPTPAELSCASPQQTCTLANFFVGDPDLKQVVARTVEAGLRGTLHPAPGVKLRYDIALFHTISDDDISFINSPTLGRAYFQNVGQTRRQGMDAGLSATGRWWNGFFAYSYTQAEYRTGFIEAAGSNPFGDAQGDISIRAGDRLPGIAASKVKFGATVHPTQAWSISATGQAQTGQYLFGDEANLAARLPGFVILDLATSYQFTTALEVFGQIDNVTDQAYYTYGTFSPTSAVFLAPAPGARNPRAYSLSAPVAGYAGVRVRF